MKVNPGINLDTCFMYMSGFQNEVRKWKKIQKINETLFCKFHMTWNSLHFLYSLHCHKNNQHKFRSTAPTQTPFSAFPLKLKIQPFILLFQWTNWQERGNGEYKKIFSTIHAQQTELISSQHFYLFVEKWKECFTFSQSQGV